jgi:hypothetical protein
MESVDLPHSWNVTRGADADGIGWYSREVVLPQALAGQHLELHFGAVFYKARIWVNGVEAGAHEGGHTAFDLDVSRLMKPGANRIVVMADNRPGFATIPGYAMRLKARAMSGMTGGAAADHPRCLAADCRGRPDPGPEAEPDAVGGQGHCQHAYQPRQCRCQPASLRSPRS